jgi:hypothetical protein
MRIRGLGPRLAQRPDRHATVSELPHDPQRDLNALTRDNPGLVVKAITDLVSQARPRWPTTPAPESS